MPIENINITAAIGRTRELITQNGHGLVVGNVVRCDNTTANKYVKALADTEDNAKSVGVVTAVTDANNFELTLSGRMTVGVPAQAQGTVMYLSDTVAGAMTTTKPTIAVRILEISQNNLSAIVNIDWVGSGGGNTYVSDTYTNWNTKLGLGTLPKGSWIEVTAIPSQPGAIFSMFCTETNQIALGGFGQFLNADWQNVGVYTGVVGLTTIPFTTNIGQWYSGIEGTAVDGDVVIWNCLHYQAVDAASFDGNDPATNTAAYTLLPMATADVGYITEVDEIEFDFVPDWLQYRADKRGNTYRYSQSIDTAKFILGYTAIDLIQWGRDVVYSINSDESKIDLLNIYGVAYTISATNGSTIENIVLEDSSTLFLISCVDGSSISGISLSNGSSAHDWNLVSSSTISAINIDTGSELYGASLIDRSSMSTITIDNTSILRNIVLGSECQYVNKTIDSSSTVEKLNITVDQDFSETLSAVSGVTHDYGLSTEQRTIDVTGLTTLDLSTVEQVGIYNVTGGATENINLISNFPTLFPFILRPAAGLTLTVTYTAVASLSAVDQVVGPTATLILNGDNGDELTLQAATIGGFAVTVQKDANTNI
jgi:hypothetical protein